MLPILLGLLALPGWAGDGNIDNGKLNLTVFFNYDEQDKASWEQLFNDANPVMFKATDGRLTFGEIRFTDCPGARAKADIIINDGAGRAFADGGIPGLGTNGRFIQLYKNSNKTEPKTLVHELGHYAFGCYDEYKGRRWAWDGMPPAWQTETTGGSVWFDGTGDPATNPWFCATQAEANGTTSCIMDFANGWKPGRMNFCLDGAHADHHVTSRVSGSKRYITDQQQVNGHACWNEVAAAVGGNVPASPPNNTSAVNSSPTFKTVDGDAYNICIDRSGSMAGDRIVKARLGGTTVVDLARTMMGMMPGDNLGVTSFSSGASTNFAVTEMTAATQAAAKAAIGSINASGGTDIGAGVRQALADLMTAQTNNGEEFCSRTVFLLSDGQDSTNVAALVADIQAAKATVHAIAIGSGADSAKLSAIATGSGGNFFFLPRQQEEISARGVFFRVGEEALPGIMATLFNEARGGSQVAGIDGQATAGQSTQHTLTVDGFVERATFLLVSANEADPLSLALTDPNGTNIDLNTPPAGVTVSIQPGAVIVDVQNPAGGDWIATVDATATAADQNYDLRLLAISPGLIVTAQVDSAAVAFPAPILVTARVSAGQALTNITHTVEVSDPSGNITNITLSDDGDLSNGDLVANDGIYSGYFKDYTDNGTYTFTITYDGSNAQYATGILPSEPGGDPFNTGSVPSFTRVASVATLVDMVPAGGGTALLPPANVRQTTDDSDSITITWDDTSGGTASFKIQRSSDGVNFQTIDTVGPGTTTYTDNSPGAGNFFYQVVANVTGVGDSPPSEATQVNFQDLEMALQAFLTGGGQTGGGVSGSSGGTNLDEFSGSSFGCFIATAAYGSYLNPHVAALRDFRDDYLLTNRPGRAVVDFYYRNSPPIAERISQSPMLMGLTRLALTPIVYSVEYPLLLVLALGSVPAFWLYRRRRRLAIASN